MMWAMSSEELPEHLNTTQHNYMMVLMALIKVDGSAVVKDDEKVRKGSTVIVQGDYVDLQYAVHLNEKLYTKGSMN